MSRIKQSLMTSSCEAFYYLVSDQKSKLNKALL